MTWLDLDADIVVQLLLARLADILIQSYFASLDLIGPQQELIMSFLQLLTYYCCFSNDLVIAYKHLMFTLN